MIKDIDKNLGCADPQRHVAAGRRPSGYLLALLAFLTCPCHLPIWLMLFGGSAFGAVLNENLMVAGAILIVAFILSGAAAIRRLNTPGS